MQSTRRPAFNFRRPVPTVPTCSPCPTAAPRQTISNVPHLHSNGIHSPLLLLSLALALLLSACPGAHACRAGSSSRNPYAYARAGGASRGAGSPPPPPVHKMPPLAFGTVVCTPLYYVTSTVHYFLSLSTRTINHFNTKECKSLRLSLRFAANTCKQLCGDCLC